MHWLEAFWLGLITAIATGFGVFPVYWAKVRERGLGVLWGVSAGVMASISVLDLLAPARNEPTPLVIGTLGGIAFVLVAVNRVTAWTKARRPDPEPILEEPGHEGEPDASGDLDHEQASAPHGHGHVVRWSSLSLLMFLVLTVHSAPEGVGIGSALQADLTVGLVVVGAIALHNIPEGTAVAVGLRADGQSMWKAFGLAIVTSLPQPLLAPIVFVVAVGPFLPAGMGFAGGAMLTLVAVEIVPEGFRTDRIGFVVGAVIGLAAGIGVNVLVPVPGL